jgi:hypothetical protein
MTAGPGTSLARPTPPPTPTCELMTASLLSGCSAGRLLLHDVPWPSDTDDLYWHWPVRPTGHVRITHVITTITLPL